MSGHSRILNTRPHPIFDQRIAMTNATSLDFNSHPSGLWFRNFPLNDFERSLRVRDLYHTHFFRHNFFYRSLLSKRQGRAAVSNGGTSSAASHLCAAAAHE